MRTRQRALLIRLANIRHVREQPYFRADLDERGEHRRDQLYCIVSSNPHETKYVSHTNV